MYKLTQVPSRLDGVHAAVELNALTTEMWRKHTFAVAYIVVSSALLYDLRLVNTAAWPRQAGTVDELPRGPSARGGRAPRAADGSLRGRWR